MNSFGKIFKITLYGTSHGEELGIVIDGCPVGIPLSEDDFTKDIERRKPTKQEYETSREETDKILIRAGVYNGFTDGTPILLSFKNESINDDDYKFITEGFFRPGHADFTAFKKYKGFSNPNGGGMFSGRMTLALVAAGVVAKKILPEMNFTSFFYFDNKYNLYEADKQDTLGGSISCEVKNVPVGLGEPFFDSVESVISHAVFSIPGVKCIKFGVREFLKYNSLLDKLNSTGSDYNDIFIDEKGTTKTNACGGINGGISNGNTLYFFVEFRPPSSISLPQETFNFKTKKIETLTLKGRHDRFFVERCPVIVEAMTAIALADLYLISKMYK